MDSNRGPSAYQPKALPLRQTGSQPSSCTYLLFCKNPQQRPRVKTAPAPTDTSTSTTADVSSQTKPCCKAQLCSTNKLLICRHCRRHFARARQSKRTASWSGCSRTGLFPFLPRPFSTNERSYPASDVLIGN